MGENWNQLLISFKYIYLMRIVVDVLINLETILDVFWQWASYCWELEFSFGK